VLGWTLFWTHCGSHPSLGIWRIRHSPIVALTGISRRSTSLLAWLSCRTWPTQSLLVHRGILQGRGGSRFGRN
jgi:hypothetical protein